MYVLFELYIINIFLKNTNKFELTIIVHKLTTITFERLSFKTH